MLDGAAPGHRPSDPLVPVPPRLEAALALIRRLTLEPDAFGPADVEAARRAGLSDDAVVDAMATCALFNTIDRVADAMAFAVPSREDFRVAARLIRRIGYALPAPIGTLTRDRPGGTTAQR